MAQREMVLATLPTTSPTHFVKVEVAYSKGGMNYFTYKVAPRGYGVRVRVVEVKGGFESYVLFNGVGSFLQEAKQFSATKLAAIAAGVSLESGIVPDMIAQVLAKPDNEGIRLAAPQPQAVL